MIGTILDWVAPTQMANGDPLPAELITGYRLYRGLTPVSLNAVLDVGITPTEKAFMDIPGATIGQWFAVSALSDLGESALSAAAQWTGTGIVPAYTMPSFARM